MCVVHTTTQERGGKAGGGGGGATESRRRGSHLSPLFKPVSAAPSPVAGRENGTDDDEGGKGRKVTGLAVAETATAAAEGEREKDE